MKNRNKKKISRTTHFETFSLVWILLPLISHFNTIFQITTKQINVTPSCRGKESTSQMTATQDLCVTPQLCKSAAWETSQVQNIMAAVSVL